MDLTVRSPLSYRRLFLSIALLIVFSMVSVIFWYYLHQFDNDLATPNTIRIDKILLSESPLKSTELIEQELGFVDLPYRSNRESKLSWFYTSFDNRSDFPLWGIFIPARNWELEVKVNDVVVGKTRSDSMTQPNWSTPAYFEFPAALLNKGTNQLAIRVEPASRTLFLSQLTLGPSDTVYPLYSKEYFARVTLQQFIVAITLMSFVLSFVLWLKRKQEKNYLWFSVISLTWAVHIFLKIIPLPYFISIDLWRVILNSSLLWFVIAGFYFLSYSTRQFASKLEHFVLVGGFFIQASYLLVLFVWESAYDFYAGKIFIPFIVLVGLFCGYRIISGLLKSRTFVYLNVVTLATLSVGIHDVMILKGYIIGHSYLPFAAPIFILFILSQLVKAFLESMTVKESLYNSFGIDPDVVDDAGMVVDWEELRNQEKQNLVSKERARFREELHDGVSGSLVSVISSLKQGEQPSSEILVPLQACMDELRAIIDSRSKEQRNLCCNLAVFRQRIRPQMKLLNIDLDWQLLELSELIDLTEEQSNNVFRIVQESFTNVFKHANATRIIFRAASSPIDDEVYRIEISIVDNGKGFSQPVSRGNGFTNMNKRSQEMNGDIRHFSNEDGTKVQLKFEHRLTLST